MFLRQPRSVRNLGYRTVKFGAKDTEVQFSIWRIRVGSLGVLVAVNCCCWRHWCGIQLGSGGGLNEMPLLEPCNISCWFWDLSLCSVTIPKMVIKVANLPQGFLLLLVFCPQEFESREDCRRAAPSLPLKPAFQDELEIVPPIKENRASLSSVFCCATSITLGCYGLCGGRWSSTEVEENVLHKTGKSGAAVCLGGSYCSFTFSFVRFWTARNLFFVL